MRILSLRLKNLNSLIGEWEIDFTHPDYEGNGIFAIIGPTGAGKTTLLDAICLALYGRTPRLGKITQSSNELMSRHTGECYAEVTFETAKGKYRSYWEQHCSQKKAGRKLQEPQREVVDAETNMVLEKHLSRVEPKVEEITGMDFQRFTRSMLLAQGSFDAFLKASPSERAPILEQITGTEIYTTISTQIFEKTKEENQKLETLHLERAAIQLLSSEQIEAYQSELQEREHDVNRLSSALQKRTEEKSWRGEFDRVINLLSDLDAAWKSYLVEEEASQADLKRLDLSMNALNFEGDYRDLCHLQAQQEDVSQRFIKANEELCSISSVLIAIQKDIALQQQKLTEMQRSYQQELERLKSTLMVLTEEQQSLSENRDALQWDEQRQALIKQNAILKQLKEELNNQVEIGLKLEETQKQITSSQQHMLNFKENEKTLLETKDKLERTMDELIQKQISQNHILSFEEERARLGEDAPCPLCGALEHPFVKEQLVFTNEFESTLTQLKKEHKELEKTLQAILKQIIQSETSLQNSTKLKQGFEMQLDQIQVLLEQQGNTREEIHQAYLENAAELDNFEKKYALFLKKNQEREQAQQAFQQKLESTVMHAQFSQQEDSVNKLKEQKSKLEHQHESLVVLIAELSKQLKELALKYQLVERAFTANVMAAGFIDLNHYRKACLTYEARTHLMHLKTALESRKNALQAEKKAAEKRLAELNEQPQTGKTWLDLTKEIQELTNQLEKNKERIILLKTWLNEDLKRREKAKTIEAKMAQQDKETQIWRKLCALIGSADGKKFRDFAQKMTLAMMIAHANRQLLKMSDRYLLKQSKTSPLELEVVDNYQAGEERSVKNLSGGEGFIVSLALALGLSQMASSKVRVDTLFLDEGFGTLDEKALEVALDTLAELHQEGKVIGLISHVTVLKERIHTQIQVHPTSGGRSRLEGPGCTAI